MKYPKLLEPGKIGNLELKNRVVMPPMAVGYGNPSGYLSEVEKAYFEERAKGGVGLLISSAFAIDNRLAGYLESGQVSLVDEGVGTSICETVDRVHKHGARFMIQLLHPGRQGLSALNNGQQPVAPSAIKEADFLEMPRELSIDEVKELIQKFIRGARIAYENGVDGVELHAAHGYLLYQFAAARANQRTDEYGGSFENRMRFIKEIIEGIQEFKPEGAILSVRANALDGNAEGMQLDEGIRILQYLEKLGVDALNVSTGTYANSFAVFEPAPIPEGNRTSWLKEVKDALTIPVIGVNNIKQPATAEQMLEDGVVDFVGLARPLLSDPFFVKKAADGEEELIRTCIGCLYCTDSAQDPDCNGSSCSVNPYLGEESIYNEETLKKDGDGRRIVIIGGGPGGMQAALVAARRGFRVTLFEGKDTLGGALTLAGKAVGKDKVALCIDHMANEIMRNDLIKVKLSHKVNDVAKIKELDPYAVIIATGALPIIPKMPGIQGENVVTAHQVLRDNIEYNNRKIALVGSGLTGLETGEMLIGKGNEITIYEMASEIAPGANMGNKFTEMQILAQDGVTFKTGYKLKEVKDRQVVFDDLKTGKEVEEEADVVILSLGVRADKAVETLLSDSCERVITIGDCAGGVRVVDATKAALREVWNL